MVIVAGHITVDFEQRGSDLVGSVSVVEKARHADGCLAVPSRPTWYTLAMSTSLSAGSPKRPSKPAAGVPPNKQHAAMRLVSVADYDIADVRPLFGEGRA